MPKKVAGQMPVTANVAYNTSSKWASKFALLASDSEDDTEPTTNTKCDESPIISPVAIKPASALREWNQSDVPKTLPYHRHTSTKWNTSLTSHSDNSWTSITNTSITPPHELDTREYQHEEITLTNTIDPTTLWSDKVLNAFEKASCATVQGKKELSEDFKQNLGKLSFFRRTLISKQEPCPSTIDP